MFFFSKLPYSLRECYKRRLYDHITTMDAPRHHPEKYTYILNTKELDRTSRIASPPSSAVCYRLITYHPMFAHGIRKSAPRDVIGK